MALGRKVRRQISSHFGLRTKLKNAVRSGTMQQRHLCWNKLLARYLIQGCKGFWGSVRGDLTVDAEKNYT